MESESTMKFFTNLDRAAIEAKLKELRSVAAGLELNDVASLLADVEGKNRDELNQLLTSCLDLAGTQPAHKRLVSELEMLQLNLPNLK